jgi:hypothetical protein
MAKTRLSNATYVERGYGQVEPNHLSAQRNGQIYAQLPAKSTINMLENGQFVKYDYEAGVVDFTGAGDWMLVYNEVKVYREGEGDADFAMIKSNYAAAVYSPVDGTSATSAHARDYRGVVTPADPYEVDSTADPFSITKYSQPLAMPTGTTMVPRVFATHVGDIMTTNTIKEATLALGDALTIGADGYLTKTGGSTATKDKWLVVKVYTMPDGQKGVKIQRVA